MSENMRSRNASGDMEDIILYRYTRLKSSVLMLPREKGYDFFFLFKRTLYFTAFIYQLL